MGLLGITSARNYLGPPAIPWCMGLYGVCIWFLPYRGIHIYRPKTKTPRVFSPRRYRELIGCYR